MSIPFKIINLFLFITFSSLFSVSAPPYPFEVEQPDGSKILVRAYGHEYYNWMETEDGYVIQYVEDDLFHGWFYSKLDENGKFVVSDILVTYPTPYNLNIPKYLKVLHQQQMDFLEKDRTPLALIKELYDAVKSEGPGVWHDVANILRKLHPTLVEKEGYGASATPLPPKPTRPPRPTRPTKPRRGKRLIANPRIRGFWTRMCWLTYSGLTCSVVNPTNARSSSTSTRLPVITPIPSITSITSITSMIRRLPMDSEHLF